jgi:hypothetical protein
MKMNRKDGVAALGAGLAGLLTGNELGTLVAVHPAVRQLPMPSALLAEQALTRRYGTLMPALMTGAITANAAAAGSATGPRRWLFAAASGTYATMLALTFLGNMPLNAATLALPTSASEAEFRSVRERWERLHLVRVALDLLALGLATAAASQGASR